MKTCSSCQSFSEGRLPLLSLLPLFDSTSLGKALRHNLCTLCSRVAVLRFLNYIDENNAVQLKGRVAREVGRTDIMMVAITQVWFLCVQINTVKDELIATELIFENVLTELPPEEIIALFSALVFELKTEAPVKLAGRLGEVRIGPSWLLTG